MGGCKSTVIRYRRPRKAIKMRMQRVRQKCVFFLFLYLFFLLSFLSIFPSLFFYLIFSFFHLHYLFLPFHFIYIFSSPLFLFPSSPFFNCAIIFPFFLFPTFTFLFLSLISISFHQASLLSFDLCACLSNSSSFGNDGQLVNPCCSMKIFIASPPFKETPKSCS